MKKHIFNAFSLKQSQRQSIREQSQKPTSKALQNYKNPPLITTLLLLLDIVIGIVVTLLYFIILYNIDLFVNIAYEQYTTLFTILVQFSRCRIISCCQFMNLWENMSLRLAFVRQTARSDGYLNENGKIRKMRLFSTSSERKSLISSTTLYETHPLNSPAS